MKNVFVVFVTFCIILKEINCQAIAEKMDKAFDLCLKAYNLRVDEIYSTNVNLTCFNACIAVKAEIIKNKKFDLENYRKYLLDVEDSRDVSQEIKAYEYCAKQVFEIRDECESYVKLEKCVNNQLFPDQKKTIQK